MTYDEAIEWLLSFADFERSGRFQDRPDVAPMLALLDRLGNPHLGRTTVHIAGSKGKGSVAAMVESILRAAGWETGLYTSPHLHSYCERIKINGETIPESKFAFLTEQLRDVTESLIGGLDDRIFVTFDLLTAIGFLAFRTQRLSAQVIEVGLGGRVDSTNVFRDKEVAVITPISLEHTAILGGTVKEIAREKLAIITPGATVIMAPQESPDVEYVMAAAPTRVTPSVRIGEDYRCQKLSHDLKTQTIVIETAWGVATKVTLPLLGAHQLENAATAVAAAAAVHERSVGDLPAQSVQEGLANVRWPGRIEVLHERPLVICDGAHNRDSARRLAETLVEYFACDRALFVIGCGSDKDIDGLAEELAPLASRVIAVRAKHPRAMDPQRIAEAFGHLSVDVELAESVANAVDRAIAASAESALICVAGSLFVAAEAREYFGLGMSDNR